MENEVHPLKDLTFGAIAGMAGKIVEFPFDTIKVRLQSSSQFANLSTWQTIQNTYLKEGVLNGFYKGLKAPMIGACMESSILFYSYNFASELQMRYLGYANLDSLSLISKCISGAFSGFAISFVLTPVEFVKCNLQVANLLLTNPSVGSPQFSYSCVIKQVMRTEGILGLWRGYTSTLAREIAGTALWFGSYEYLVSKLKKWQFSETSASLIGGAVAGISFNTATFPVDTVKSVIQVSSSMNNNDLSILKTAFQVINKKGGVRNLYNGLGITLIRAAPANALIFYTYELLKSKFS